MKNIAKVTAKELKDYTERIEKLDKERRMCKISFVMYMQKRR
ncbi:hypothetical protein [Wolbachia endosymbiont of Litomosoides brasiliensis]|nr:hypothetical protein [Wolbachia endosymbiont of Litomosoides brasiliensis]